MDKRLKNDLSLFLELNNSTLKVRVKNNVAKPINIWSRECSWGWQMISIGIASSNSEKKKLQLLVFPKAWTRNFPQVVLLDSNEEITIEFNSGLEEWSRVSDIKSWRDQVFEVTATLEIEETIESKEHSVWTGKVESEAYKSTPPHNWLFTNSLPQAKQPKWTQFINYLKGLFLNNRLKEPD